MGFWEVVEKIDAKRLQQEREQAERQRRLDERVLEINAKIKEIRQLETSNNLRVSVSEQQQVIAARQQGQSLEEIQRNIGISPNTVRKILKLAGRSDLLMSHGGVRQELSALANRRRARGLNIQQAAKLIGCSPGFLSRIENGRDAGRFAEAISALYGGENVSTAKNKS